MPICNNLKTSVILTICPYATIYIFKNVAILTRSAYAFFFLKCAFNQMRICGK